MIGRTNALSAAGVELSLVVSVTTGSVVTATKGSLSVSGTASGGSVTLKLPEAGTWSVVATYNGQTSDTKTVSVVDSYAVVLTFFSATINVTVPSGATVYLKKDGTTLQTKTSTGTVAFTVTETGTYTVEATNGSQTTSGTVSVASATSYALTLSFVSSTLNDNEWSVIKTVSDAGEGANYWSIGDRKAVALSGTVGALSMSGTHYAFIIGFNHNSGVEGSGRIHFQFGKTALSGGSDICFVDSKYGNTGSDAAFRMNTSNTNSGGWNNSYMRNTICPAFKNALPAALKSVLKTVTKYTDNTGNSTAASAVTATTDDIFLLAEYEVFGTIARGNTNESSKQQQYAYYSAGNSKIKNKHSATGEAALWWLRSPGSSSSTYFVFVDTDGTVYYTSAYYSLGFAPGFCV